MNQSIRLTNQLEILRPARRPFPSSRGISTRTKPKKMRPIRPLISKPIVKKLKVKTRRPYSFPMMTLSSRRPHRQPTRTLLPANCKPIQLRLSFYSRNLQRPSDQSHRLSLRRWPTSTSVQSARRNRRPPFQFLFQILLLSPYRSRKRAVSFPFRRKRILITNRNNRPTRKRKLFRKWCPLNR